MPFLEEITPRASYEKEEHEDWEYFPLQWENTQPASFPPFFTPVLQQNRKMCWWSLVFPGKLQVASPASKSNSPETSGVAASFKECQNHHQNPIFLLKRKGWKLLLLDSRSGMELLQDADPKGSCHITACITCGVQPHPPGQLNTPRAPRSLGMARIPWDPAALPGMPAPAFPQSEQTSC